MSCSNAAMHQAKTKQGTALRQHQNSQQQPANTTESQMLHVTGTTSWNSSRIPGNKNIRKGKGHYLCTPPQLNDATTWQCK
jgi:hypothetical protein